MLHKSMLLLRRVESESATQRYCLLFFCQQANGKVEYFFITDCSEQQAIELRYALRKSTGASLWLFLEWIYLMPF
jgi:hypothetical protein